jgi:hypothetical protein
MYIDLQFWIRLFFSYLDFLSLSLLSLSIYRIPIMMYWKRLLIIPVVFILVMILYNQIFPSRDYYALIIAFVSILISMTLLRIPLLYSSLIWGTGYLLHTLLQTGIIIFVTNTGIITMEQMMSSPILPNLGMLTNFLVILLIMYILEKKRLGFMFVMNRFRLQNRGFQIKDVFVAAFFICAVSLIQMGIASYFSNQLNHYLLTVLGSMIVISLIGLYITYKFNMQEIEERFSSFRGS